MPLPRSTANALSAQGVDFESDVPLIKKTWWRAGGPADGFVLAPDLPTLVAVQRAANDTGCPLFVLGNASNLLVSDRGVRGMVVRLTGALAEMRVEPGDPPTLKLGAGLKLVRFLSWMQRHAWTGLEGLAGIPGTIGGAVRMNAGTTLGEVVDTLVDVGLVTAAGEVRELPASALNMAYRHAELPEGAIVSWARFRTGGLDPQESRERVQAHLDYRARTQPVDVPTCGSTFRNPPDDTAGRLIEATGLKGLRIGAAEVSQKHANFIVNTGGATADDIRALVERVQREVQTAQGVSLRREVHFAGDWSHWSSRGA